MDITSVQVQVLSSASEKAIAEAVVYFFISGFQRTVRRKENEFGQNQKMDAFLLFDRFVLHHLYDFYRGLFRKKSADVDRSAFHCGGGFHLFSPWGLLSLRQTPAHS